MPAQDNLEPMNWSGSRMTLSRFSAKSTGGGHSGAEGVGGADSSQDVREIDQELYQCGARVWSRDKTRRTSHITDILLFCMARYDNDGRVAESIEGLQN